jgi:acyl-CoA carboxylase subunit beta
MKVYYLNLNEKEPFYDREEILGIVQSNIRVPFDSRELIARIVDGSRFSEFKPLYGSTLICCEAKLYGTTIGILSNNGVIFSDSANKGIQSKFSTLRNSIYSIV